MVENEIKSFFASLALCLLAPMPLQACSPSGNHSRIAFSASWKAIPVDGSRTGVVASSASNVQESMGTLDKKGVYTSPSGRVFRSGVTPSEADVIISAQGSMVDLKSVIARSQHGMRKGKPTSSLTNWAADTMIEEFERRTGIRADVSLINSGGIRVDIGPGEVLKDDIVSMFPFKNKLVLCRITGENLLKIFSRIAVSAQGIGGASFVARGEKILQACIAGQTLDPARVYSLVSIDFLLDGGDGFNLRQISESVMETDYVVADVMLEAVLRLAAGGGTLDYPNDNRIVLLK